MNERAHAVGLPSFNEHRICSNTIKSHRLVRWVTLTYGLEKSEALFDLLNYEHFINGKKLNDTNFLVSCCGMLGIDMNSARTFLTSDEGRDVILNTIQTLQTLNVTSIPVFVINSFWGLEGAVTASKFMSIFRDIENHILLLERNRQKVQEKAPLLFGGLLGIQS